MYSPPTLYGGFSFQFLFLAWIKVWLLSCSFFMKLWYSHAFLPTSHPAFILKLHIANLAHVQTLQLFATA